MKKSFAIAVFCLLALSGVAFAQEVHEHMETSPFQVEWGPRGAQELINIHLLFVHFPIALLLTSVAVYMIGFILKKRDLLIAGKWTLYLGSISAAFAVWTGLEAAKTVSHSDETHQIMMMHQYLGIAVMILSVFLSGWLLVSRSEAPTKWRIAFIGALLLVAILLMQQADFGGRMVFSHGVGVGRKSMLQQETLNSHQHEHAGEAADHYDHGNQTH